MFPRFFLPLVLALTASFAFSAAPLPTSDKARVFVLTDISNEPDDEESLVRFLVYANEYDIEGLVATTSTWLRQNPREDLIRRQLAAYAQVQPNLLLHAPDFPSAEQLAAVTATGQPGYGLAHVGPDKSTPGSRLLVSAIEKSDPRPLWISVWGGANTLAQALLDLRASRSPADLDAAISRLRVYGISDQDDSGSWIRREFPDLFYIVSPSTQDEKEYWRATWTGISGDRFYRNAPGLHADLVDNPWLAKNIIHHHGPLGALYPPFAYIMEGDTPSFLGLIRNGLGWTESPAYGGWGGRYVLYRAHGETRPIWTNNATSRDTVTLPDGRTDTSDPATIWRWREHFQNDFAARMDWCVAPDFTDANHNPVVVLNRDTSRRVLQLSAAPGAAIDLSAEGTSDPDHDPLSFKWWIYPEPSTLPGATLSDTDGLATTVQLPSDRRGTVHVILQVTDAGAPALTSYRRALISSE